MRKDIVTIFQQLKELIIHFSWDKRYCKCYNQQAMISLLETLRNISCQFLHRYTGINEHHVNFLMNLKPNQ